MGNSGCLVKAQYRLPDPTMFWTLDGPTAANFGAFVAMLLVPTNSNTPRPDAVESALTSALKRRALRPHPFFP